MINTNKIIKKLETLKCRSAWARAVRDDAIDLLTQTELNEIDLSNTHLLEKALLGGAENWHQYSWGGCGLVYDCDIAKHYCTKSELKVTQNGLKRPNSKEQWLDTQARALYQACELIKNTIKGEK